MGAAVVLGRPRVQHHHLGGRGLVQREREVDAVDPARLHDDAGGVARGGAGVGEPAREGGVAVGVVAEAAVLGWAVAETAGGVDPAGADVEADVEVLGAHGLAHEYAGG